MRILLVCERTDGSDGWSRYTHNLQTALTERGHDVHVVCAPLLRRPLDYLINPFRAFLSAQKLKKVIQDMQPDVIHITVEPYVMMLPFIGKNIAKRTVLTIHGSYGIRIFGHWATRPLSYAALYRIAQFITVSAYTQGRVQEELRRRGKDALVERFLERTTIIHNGIALPEEWQPLEKSEKKHLLLVGGVKPRKGVLQALDACSTYKKKYGKPFTFTIVGSLDQRSDYVTKVKERIESLGLMNEVILKGTVSDEELVKAYRQADLYLMPALTGPNTFEGFGLVYIEANAFGVPCIGPNESGAKEAIEEGKSGYHVDPHDHSMIAERMHWILDEARINPEDTYAWAEKFNSATKAREVEELYASIEKTSATTSGNMIRNRTSEPCIKHRQRT